VKDFLLVLFLVVVGLLVWFDVAQIFDEVTIVCLMVVFVVWWDLWPVSRGVLRGVRE